MEEAAVHTGRRFVIQHSVGLNSSLIESCEVQAITTASSLRPGSPRTCLFGVPLLQSKNTHLHRIQLKRRLIASYEEIQSLPHAK